MTGTSHYVEHGGVTIHYRDERPDVAPDARPPVVFVPGMTCVADDYAGIADLVGRRTIVIDVRGHGRSSAPDTGYSVDDHADDIGAVIDAALGSAGDVHLMTFSRGTCYTLRWCQRRQRCVRSLTIGDYPAREIAIAPSVVTSMMERTWRGSPVAERVAEHALVRTCEQSQDRPFWDVVGALEGPVAVVRTTAPVPLTDADWERYRQLPRPIRMLTYDDAPHDVFRPDRTRFPRLVAATVAAAEQQIPNAGAVP